MAEEVSDPSDWHASSLPFLAQFDAGLRCQVCKDYFTSAVITTCSHTFCSLCIRRCLAAEGRCPTCRTNEQEVRLRRNVAVQELTDMFVAARPDALQRAKEVLGAEETQKTQHEGRDRKRKRGEGITENGAASPPRRRSQRLQVNGHSSPSPQEVTSFIDDLQNYAEKDTDYEPEDGLVPCPICQKRMKAEAVFGHLDKCEDEQTSNARRSSHPVSRSQTTTPVQIQQQDSKAPPERLPQTNYSLLKDNGLRKKLSELSISSSGSRALLIRRHTEWINLWNANCDSVRPRSRRELLTDLDAWERSQGSFAANGGQPQTAAVMRKDFDGVAWAKRNKDDFSSLIASAQRKREQPAAAPAPTSSTIASAQNATIHPPTQHASETGLAPTEIPTPTNPAKRSISSQTRSSQPSEPHHAAATSSHRNPSGARPLPIPPTQPPINGAPRRGSAQWPDNDPPSIFAPSHPTTDIQRTGNRSPVPGFSFEKSVQFGGRDPPPPRLLHASSQQSTSSRETPELRSPEGRRGSKTDWPPCGGMSLSVPAPAQRQAHNQAQAQAQGRRRSTQSNELMDLQSAEAQSRLPKAHSMEEPRPSSSHVHGTRKPLMFEIPAGPVLDSEMSGSR